MSTNQMQPWQPLTDLSPEAKAAQSKELLRYSMTETQAFRAAKRLIGQWPHAKPADPDMYALSLSAVLSQYPFGIVEEACDPRRGLAREREFPPTVAALVEFCDRRLAHHRAMAQYRPSAVPKRIEQHFSDEHRMSMLKRLRELIHSIFNPPPTPEQIKAKFGISDEVWESIPDRPKSV